MSTLDKCFWGYGYAWNRLSHYDDDATISHKQTFHLTGIKRSNARVSRQRRRGSKVRGKKVGAHSHVRLSLEIESLLPVHDIFGSRALLLFGEPLQFTLAIPRKKSNYLHTKQRPLWLHLSFFTHFNQPLTINNIAAVTPAYYDAQVYALISSCYFVSGHGTVAADYNGISVKGMNKDARPFWTFMGQERAK